MPTPTAPILASSSAARAGACRVLVREGKKQIYGTQLRSGPDIGGKIVLLPIDDEEHVDERRKAAGLGPLAEYVKKFGLEYKPVKK